MTQHVDVRIEFDPPKNPIILTDQTASNPAIWTRMQRAAYTAKRITIERHTVPAPSPPPPAPSSALSDVRNLIVFATVTDDAITYACRLGPPWRALICADPAYWKPGVATNPVTFAQMKALAAAGMGPACWIGPGLHPQAAVDFMTHWDSQGIPPEGWYGEGETPQGFDEHTRAVWKPIGLIGNLTALRPDQQALVKAGSVLFNWEAYYNKADQHYGDIQSYLDNTGPYKGTDKTCLCYAVYASSSENATYTPAAQQKANGWIAPHASWYVEGFTEADWKAIGA